MVDFVTARDQICERFNMHWQTNAAGIVGYIPEIRFPRIVYKTPIDPSVHWGRLSLQTVNSEQVAFGCNGKKRYNEIGLVFVQLFGPISEIEAGEQQDKFAQIARAAFRGANVPGAVWFRNARINDLDPEDQMLRLNVVAEYEYNETV